MERVGTVWLVGMMGAGKSAVGRALASRLGRRFVDMDAEIERAAGRGVAAIFTEEGESAFRAREREAVEAWVGSGAVVALGGGAIAQPAVREKLKGAGTTVYLRATPETLLSRLGAAAERPLLAGLAPAQRLARLRGLLAEREPAYACAELHVDTEGVAVDEIVERIARALDPPQAPGGEAGLR